MCFRIHAIWASDSTLNQLNAITNNMWHLCLCSDVSDSCRPGWFFGILTIRWGVMCFERIHVHVHAAIIFSLLHNVQKPEGNNSFLSCRWFVYICFVWTHSSKQDWATVYVVHIVMIPGPTNQECICTYSLLTWLSHNYWLYSKCFKTLQTFTLNTVCVGVHVCTFVST